MSVAPAIAAGKGDKVHSGDVIPHVIVHFDHKARPHGKPGGGTEEDTTPADERFVLLPGQRMGGDTTVAIVIDDPGIPGAVAAVRDAFEAWDAVSGITFNNGGVADVNPNVEFSGPNDQNTVSWALLVGSWTNALAVTTLWIDDKNSNGIWDEDEPFTESDMVYNTKFTWAVDPDGEGPQKPDTKGKWYDIRAIGTHEAGHFVGLDDQSQWNEQTMYRSAGPKETKKVTLEAGDIAGAVARYGGP